MRITCFLAAVGMGLGALSGASHALVPIEPIWNLDSFADAGGGAKKDSAEKLEQMYADYDEEFLALNPMAATFRGDHRYNDRWSNPLYDEYQRKSRQLVQKYLDRVNGIDPKDLTGQDRISYDVFKYNMTQQLEGFELGLNDIGNMVPVNQMFSLHNFIPQLASGQSAQPFQTVEHYDDWLARSKGFAEWMDAAVVSMRKGAENHIVQPRIIMEKVVPQLAAHIVDAPEKSVFYTPVTRMPDTFSDADRERLTKAYAEHISKVIVPAYRRLHDYIVDEYLPATRDTVGLADIPGGKDLYAYLSRQFTTTNLTPEEIHRIGKDEAERIYAEMERIKDAVGFEGSMSEWFEHLRTDPRFFYDTPAELMAGYEDLRGRINPALDGLFNLKPKTDYVLKEVEPYRAQAMAAAQYFPAAADGSRPGMFYVNTHNVGARPKYVMEALSLHEANPGHHFQTTLAQELTALPAFRRFNILSAYVEGWGLYAESLGTELGLYDDPYQYFGMLYFDIWRANRLVVDTGMHALGWSRQQAIDWMLGNSPMTEQDVVAEVDRYIAIPGQALSYKIGQLKIRELRQRAETELGDAFDVREFHDAVLTTGSVPLDVLEQKIDRWIAGKS